MRRRLCGIHLRRTNCACCLHVRNFGVGSLVSYSRRPTPLVCAQSVFLAYNICQSTLNRGPKTCFATLSSIVGSGGECWGIVSALKICVQTASGQTNNIFRTYVLLYTAAFLTGSRPLHEPPPWRRRAPQRYRHAQRAIRFAMFAWACGVYVFNTNSTKAILLLVVN